MTAARLSSPVRLGPPANDDAASGPGAAAARPTRTQERWLRRGLDQPGGKLPLFDKNGQRMGKRTIRACLEAGWAEPWFDNPLKPDWLVCRLTEAGRRAIGAPAPDGRASPPADDGDSDARDP